MTPEETASALPELSLLAFPDWLAQNPTKEPLQKYRGYSDYVKQETLAQGRYSDTLVQKLDAKLAGLAVESGDYTPAEGTEPLVSDVLARPKSEELPVQSIFNIAYSTETPDDDPLRGAVSKYEAIRRLQDEGRGTPEELAAAEADLRQLATPELLSRAVRKDVKEGRSLAAIVPPADPDGVPTVEINDSLFDFVNEDGTVDEPALGKVLKLHNTDASLIPAIRAKLARPDGYAKTAAEIERHGEAMTALDTLARTADGKLFDELKKVANSRERGNSYAQEFGEFRLKQLTKGTPLEDADLLTLADDFNRMNEMPEIDEVNPSAALRTLSTGAVVAPLNLMLNEAAFTKALDAVPPAQRPHIQAQRDYAVEASASDVIRTLADAPEGADEFVAYLDAQRAAGVKDSQIVKDWVAQGKYSSTRTMLQGIRSSLGEAVMPLVALATGADPDGFAIKAMQGAQIEDANRRAVADLFGKPVGMGYDLTRLVAPVAVDLGVSFLTRGAAVGATTAARATAGAAVKSLFRTALTSETRSLVGAWVRSSARSGLKSAGLQVTGRETVDEVVSMAGRDIVNKIATGTAYATSMATAFNRSALSTYASLSTALANQTNPDGTAKYSPEEVKEIAMTHGLASGTITAAVMGGFMGLGAPGMEMVLRKGLTSGQYARIAGRLKKDVAGFGAADANAMIAQFVKQGVTPLFKSPALLGVVQEGAEEGLDEFMQYFNEAMATGDRISIADAAKQAMYAASLGGVMGGTIAGVGTAIKDRSTPPARVEADIRRERLLEMAAKLESTAPQTAQVFRNYAFQQRALIPQRQQLEGDLKAAKTPEAKAEIQKKIDTLNEQATRSRTDELAPTATTEEGIPEADVAEGTVPPPSDAGMDREGEGVDAGTPEAGRRGTLGGFTGTPVAQRMRATRETVERDFNELVEPEVESFVPADGGEAIPGAVQARDVNRPEQMTPAQYVERFKNEVTFGGDPDVVLRKRHKSELESLAREDVESVREGAIGAQYPLNAEAVEAYGVELPDGFVKQGDFYVYSPSPTDSLPEGQVASASSPEATLPGLQMPPRKRSLSSMRDATVDKLDALDRRLARESDTENYGVLEAGKQRLTALLGQIETVMMTEAQEARARAVTPEGEVRPSADPEDIVTIAEAQDVPVVEVVKKPRSRKKLSPTSENPLQTGRRTGTQVEAARTPDAETNAGASEDAPSADVGESISWDTPPSWKKTKEEIEIDYWKGREPSVQEVMHRSKWGAAADRLHKQEVRRAIQRGENVPQKVLDEYPDLIAEIPTPSTDLTPGTPITFTSSVPPYTEPTQGTVDRVENGRVFARVGRTVIPGVTVIPQNIQPAAVNDGQGVTSKPSEGKPSAAEPVPQRDPSKPEQITPTEWEKKSSKGLTPSREGVIDEQYADLTTNALEQALDKEIPFKNVPQGRISGVRVTNPKAAQTKAANANKAIQAKRDARAKEIILQKLAEGYTPNPYEAQAISRYFPERIYEFYDMGGFVRDPANPKEYLGYHALEVNLAARNRKPVSSEAVDTYGIKLPEGYVKQGELYVYQPDTTDTLTPGTPITFTSPMPPSFGNPVQGTIDRVEDGKVFARVGRTVIPGVTVIESQTPEPVISDILADVPEGYPLDRDTAKLVSAAVVMPGGLLSAMAANPVVADAVKRYAASVLKIETQGMENDLAGLALLTQRELEADSVLAALRGESVERDLMDYNLEKLPKLKKWMSERAQTETDQPADVSTAVEETLPSVPSDRSRRLRIMFGENFEPMLVEAQDLLRRNTMPKRQQELKELMAMLIFNKGFGQISPRIDLHSEKMVEAMLNGKPNLVDKVLATQDIQAAELTKNATRPSAITSFGYEKDGRKYTHPKNTPTDTPRNLPSSTPSSAVTAELNKFGFSEGLPTFLQNVAKKGGKQYSGLAKLLLDAGAGNVDIRTVNLPNTEAAGFYVGANGVVHINTAKNGPRGAVDTVLHELVHAVTEGSLRNPTPAQAKVIARIERVRATVTKRAKANGTFDNDLQYALGDNAEFLTHFFTSQRFRDQVSAMTPKSEKNWLQVIADLIADLIAGRTRAQRLEADLRKELTTLITAPRAGLAPSDVVMRLPAEPPSRTPELDNELRTYLTGGLPSDPDARTESLVRFGIQWSKRYGDLARLVILPTGMEMQARIGRGGDTVVRASRGKIGDLAKNARSEYEAIRIIGLALNEEYFHAAQYAALKDTVGESDNYTVAVAEKVLEIYREMETLSIGAPDIGESAFASAALYLEQEDMSDMAPFSVEDALRLYQGNFTDVVNELTRQVVQLQRIGSMNEIELLDTTTEWTKNLIRRVEQVADGSQNLGEAFARNVENTIQTLDKRGIRFQPASDARNVARFHQLTESLYRGRDEATAAEIEAWKAENPEAWEELSAMREEVLRAGGWDVKAYHGTNANAYSDSDFTVFHTRGERGASFFSSKPEEAANYGEKTYDVMLSLQNPLVIDAKGKSWVELDDAEVLSEPTEQLQQKREKFAGEAAQMLRLLGIEVDEGSPLRPIRTVEDLSVSGSDTDSLAKFARQYGYDGAIFKNVKDSPTAGIYENAPQDTYAVFSPSQIKNASPITEGRRVTPDRWADAASPDIRFQPSNENDTQMGTTRTGDSSGGELPTDIGREESRGGDFSERGSLMGESPALRPTDTSDGVSPVYAEKTLRDTATGFLPDDVTLNDLTIDFADLADITEGLDPVNAENAVHAAVNHALARRAGEAAIPAPVRSEFDSDEAFDAATQEHAAEVARLTDTYELITRGRLTSQAMFRYRTNPGALQRLVDYLTAAIKAAYNRFTTRYDVGTAVALNRMSRDLARARVGFNHDIEPMAAYDADAAEVRFQFAGESANTPQFMRDSLDTAKAMAAAGKPSEEIRAVTGWFPGKYDGKMRWEIPDAGAKLNDGWEDADTLGEALDHPALFAAYPALRDVSLGAISDSEETTSGLYDPTLNRIFAAGVDEKSMFSTLLHEVQHAIQEIEGTAKGSMPEAFAPGQMQLLVNKKNLAEYYRKTAMFVNSRGPLTTEIVEDMTPSEQERAMAAYDNVAERWLTTEELLAKEAAILKEMETVDFDGSASYNRTAGEIEARDVQARANMTPEQLAATAPYSSENIAPEDAIVLMNSSGASDIRFLPAASPARQEQQLLEAEAPMQRIETLFKRDPGVKAGADITPSENKVIRRLTEFFISPFGALSRSNTKSKQNRDAMMQTMEYTVSTLSKRLDAARRKEDADLTLVQLAVGNIDPLLTPAMQEKIADDFVNGVSDAEQEIEATYEQEAQTNPVLAAENRAVALAEAHKTAERNRQKAIWSARSAEADSRRAQQLQALAQLERTAPDTYEAIIDLRGTVNRLQRLVKEANPDSPEIHAIVDQSFGVYLVRSYGIHQDPKQVDLMMNSQEPLYKERREALTAFFKEKAFEQIMSELDKDPQFFKQYGQSFDYDKALADMKRIAEAESGDRAKLMFEDYMLSRQSARGTFGEGSTVTNEIQRYMAKANMPQEFLDALMVNEDPVFNIANTAMSLSRLVFNSRMLNEIYDSGIESGRLITEAEFNTGITYADGKEEMRRVFGTEGNDEVKLEVLDEIVKHLEQKAKEAYDSGRSDTPPDRDALYVQAATAMQDFASTPNAQLSDILPQLGRRADRTATDTFISSRNLSRESKAKLQARPGRFAGWQPLVTTNVGNSAFKPLGGMYAEPEQVKAFNATFRINSNGIGHFADDFVNKAHRSVIAAAGASLLVATQGSPSYYVRNVVGNTFVGLMSGVTPFNRENLMLAARTFRNLVNERGEPTAEMQELIAGRIVMDAAQIGYIKQLIEDYTGNPDATVEDLVGESARADIKAGKLAKGSKKAAKAFMGKLAKLSEATEVLATVMIYADFKRILEEANFGSEIEIIQEASRLTKRVTPGRSETASGVTAFTRSGFGALFAPFLRFKVDTVRIMVNSLKLAHEMSNSDNPVLRKHGRIKMASWYSTVGLLSIAMPLIFQRAFGGFGEDEDEAIRASLPDYYRNASLLYFRNAEGNGLNIINTTFTNPLSFVGDPISRITNATLFGDASDIPGILGRFVTEDFIGENIVASNVMDVMRNKNSNTDHPIYFEADSDTDKILKSAKHLGLSYTPRLLIQGDRFVDSIRREGDEEFWYSPLGVAAATFMPFRPIPKTFDDMERAAFNNIRKENSELWRVTSPIFSPAPLAAGEATERYAERVAIMEKQARKALELYDGFTKIRGGDEASVKRSAVGAGMSKRRATLLFDRGLTERLVFPEDDLRRVREIDPARYDEIKAAMRERPSLSPVER